MALHQMVLLLTLVAGSFSAEPDQTSGSLRGSVSAGTPAGDVATAAASCEDHDEQCKAWAELGECKVNPAYMLQFCARSCDSCPQMTTAAPATTTDTTTTVAPTTAAPTPAPATETPSSTAAPAPAPVEVAIPGVELCKRYGFSIDTCYREHGFMDGDCKCVPGLWEGEYTWYQWICSTKEGKPSQTHFCSQDCNGGCHL